MLRRRKPSMFVSWTKARLCKCSRVLQAGGRVPQLTVSWAEATDESRRRAEACRLC